MKKRECLCVIGGNADVTEGRWEEGYREVVWVNSPTEFPARQGFCTKPLSCDQRGLCTGKVRFTVPSRRTRNGTIVDLVVPVSDIVRHFNELMWHPDFSKRKD